MKKTFVVLISFLFLLCVFNLPFAYSEDTVMIVSYAGDVKVTGRGETEPGACKPGQLLKSGAMLTTGEESFIEIAFDRMKENTVRIEEKTEVIVRLNSSDKIELVQGDLLVMLRNLPKGTTFRVKTPDGVCGARGTGWWMQALGGVTTVAVFDSTVFMRGINKDGTLSETEVNIKAGYQRTILRYEDPGEMVMVPEDKLEKIKKEAGIAINRSKISKVMGKERYMEKRGESVLAKKDDTRLEKLRDERSKEGSCCLN